MTAKQALHRFRAPDEREAEARAWSVLRSAYQERLPPPRHTSYRRPALAFLLAALLAAVVLSPAGATVGRLIGRALGVRGAAAALGSLPTEGRLLVSDRAGTWIVSADGVIRRLGQWPQAAWSPHALYVAVAGRGHLAAVDLHGRTQWSIARPNVSDPRWYPPTGYRVAYRSGQQLRVVAGDGTGDRLLAARVAAVAPAWRPSHPYQLAYVAAGDRVTIRDGDTGRRVWSTDPGVAVQQLRWSSDGRQLLVLSAAAARIYAPDGGHGSVVATPRNAPVMDGAISPDGNSLAVILGGGDSELLIENLGHPGAASRRVLAGVGLRQINWSPDGRWLLISWPAANQWVFVRVNGDPRIAAVSRIAEQFSLRRGGAPQLEGWCCTLAGTAG